MQPIPKHISPLNSVENQHTSIEIDSGMFSDCFYILNNPLLYLRDKSMTIFVFIV